MTFKSRYSPGNIRNICVNMHQIWWFLYCFRGVGIFELLFLSHFLIKQICFCAHWKGNFLASSKLILLLSLVHCQRLKTSFTKKIPLFRGKPFSSLKMASYQLKCINYQMDHIWLAPSILNKSLDLELGSQWSNTLYRSFIMTLYVCIFQINAT